MQSTEHGTARRGVENSIPGHSAKASSDTGFRSPIAKCLQKRLEHAMLSRRTLRNSGNRSGMCDGCLTVLNPTVI